MSDAHKGEKNHFYGKIHTKKVRSVISKKLKIFYKDKENHPWYGKHHSEKTKTLLSIINTGKTHSEETKKKISMSNKGKSHTEEAKKKISNAHRGRAFSEDTRRMISETLKELFKNPKNHPMYGKRHTDESKKKMRENRIGKCTGKNSPRYGKSPNWETRKWWKKGEKRLGHGVRSSWEFDFAIFLQDQQIEYDYEPKTFEMEIDGKLTTYAPDFYIPLYDTWFEIKGYMRELAQKKIDCFKRINPNFELIEKEKHRFLFG